MKQFINKQKKKGGGADTLDKFLKSRVGTMRAKGKPE